MHATAERDRICCSEPELARRILPGGIELSCSGCGLVLFVPWTAGSCGVPPSVLRAAAQGASGGPSGRVS